MGAFLAVPLGYFINLVTTETPDIFYWLKKVISYLYLHFYHRSNGRRFDLYDNTAVNDPHKLAFLVPPLETELESPHTEAHLQKAADEVFCYGVNSKSECLVARVARSSNDEAEAWIYLKLANGKTYHLPPEVVHQQSGDKSVFSSGGLKMHYLSPMRRWRISYNGLLREISKDNPEGRIVHVKFGFIWVASSDVFDMTSDMNLSELAKGLAREKWKSPVPPVKRFFEMVDSYAQSGMLSGTASVEGEEDRDIYLWGGRLRFLGRTAHTEGMQFLHILGTVKNGSVIHIGKISVPNIVKDLHIGYVVQANGRLMVLKEANFLFKDEEHLEESYKDVKVNFTAGLTYELEVKFREHATSFQSGKGWGGVAAFNHVDLAMNIHHGSGVVIIGKATKEPPRTRTLPKTPPMTRVIPFVVPFTEEICQLSDLSGGKGSSLGKLTQISQGDQRFTVPKGVVVTTAAYKEFMQGDILNLIRGLEDAAYGNAKNLKVLCNRITKHVEEMLMPDEICHSIEATLLTVFRERLNKFRFAVRSSATGEDTEQMSAAGQMETYLGVRGLKEVLTAVKKSWASQFGFVAIQYKRRYGQVLNSPMAVVIQEMVPCEIAGVMFTCDPVTSNPTFISISANYGLGESVVSATSEPDTVILRRDIENKLSLDSITVGSKDLKIVMDDSGGTKEEEVSLEAKEKCCLSEEQALLLGSIGVNVEKSYCSLRDIEWGIFGNKVHLLQSRPVTSGDAETDFEIKHEFNCPLRSEDEYLSVCNVGEVMPGASTPLGLDVMMKYFGVGFQTPEMRLGEGDKLPICRYYSPVLFPFYNHIVFNLIDLFFRFDAKQSTMMKSTMLGMFGRILDDEEMFTIAADRQRGSKPGIPRGFYLKVIRDCFLSGYALERAKKAYKNYRIPVENCATAQDVYDCLAFHCSDLNEPLLRHMSCSYSSSMWNMSLLTILANARGDFCTEVYSDFADLLATCTNVESADVPAAIQSVAYTITQNINPEQFKSMTSEDALEWLRTSSNPAATKFNEFLSKHGHRCLKEFDLHSMPWGTNPLPLVKMLQGFVGSVNKDSVAKKHLDANEVISKLHVPLTFKSKLLLKFLLPQCRQGVRNRESSKSLLIKSVDSWRQAYCHLAKLMVLEGRIPETDIFFFFTFEELGELLKTRSPKLLAKANHRRRLYPELDRYIFPEIMKGVPKPVNLEKNETAETGNDATTLMTGMPVSQGVAKGYARVALNLEEAESLKSGEILIAYSTDIGWSPYFPVLAGVVTELGGLISHGAVVAREYGLPCVVGLHGATRTFHTGDYVLLDGNKGILQKLTPPSSEDQ